jgi:hypothetical protein
MNDIGEEITRRSRQQKSGERVVADLSAKRSIGVSQIAAATIIGVAGQSRSPFGDR